MKGGDKRSLDMVLGMKEEKSDDEGWGGERGEGKREEGEVRGSVGLSPGVR